MIKRIAGIAIFTMMTCMCSCMANESDGDYICEVDMQIGSSTVYKKRGAPYICRKEFEAECAPEIIDNTIMIPLRITIEGYGFGGKVEWEDTEEKTVVTLNNTVLEFKVGSNIATINGQEEILPQAPYLKNENITMVPSEFLAESFYLNHEFNTQKQTLSISGWGEVSYFGVAAQEKVKLADVILTDIIINGETFKGLIYCNDTTSDWFDKMSSKHTVEAYNEYLKILKADNISAYPYEMVTEEVEQGDIILNDKNEFEIICMSAGIISGHIPIGCISKEAIEKLSGTVNAEIEFKMRGDGSFIYYPDDGKRIRMN